MKGTVRGMPPPWRFSMLVAAVAALASMPVASGAAPLNVVATTSSMAMLSRAVGGDAVNVTALAPADRDPHYLMARPSMMMALRRANLVVAVGADLEAAWLPAAIQSSANPRVQRGQQGYFDGATQLELIERGQAADRSRGDVHPLGNPHYYMDPLRMARVGQALAARMAELAPASAEKFRANAQAFERAVIERVPGWRQQVSGVPGVVFFHKDGNYLADLLGVTILGYVEPVPGVPPTASHLRGLVERLKGGSGVIIYATFQPDDGPQFLAKSLGWKVQRLQLEAGERADVNAYLAHIDRWVAAIASGKP